MKSPDAAVEARLGRALASLDASGGEPDLPDPAILWRKARLLEALDARRIATRPVQLAHSIALALAAGALSALAGSKGVSLLGWLQTSSASLMLPLTLSLFLLGAGLFLAMGAAAGRNLARRSN